MILNALRRLFGRRPAAAGVKPAEPVPEVQRCPVCSAEVPWYPRYPRYVCRACDALAGAEDGRLVRFYDEPVFAGRYADTGEPYASDVCFIRGVRCRARPAHLGGVVIELEE